MMGICIPFLKWVVELKGDFSEHNLRISAAIEGEPEWVEAITNRVLSQRGDLMGYVLFSEHDNIDSSQVIADRVEQARKKLKFGPVVIIKSSSRGYHTIVPEVRSYQDAMQYLLLMDADHSIDGFRASKTLALRTSEKNGMAPIAIGIFGERSRHRVSFGHIRALEDNYRLPHNRIIEAWGKSQRADSPLTIKKYIYHRPLIR